MCVGMVVGFQLLPQIAQFFPKFSYLLFQRLDAFLRIGMFVGALLGHRLPLVVRRVRVSQRHIVRGNRK